jgi:hypothetical protein
VYFCLIEKFLELFLYFCSPWSPLAFIIIIIIYFFVVWRNIILSQLKIWKDIVNYVALQKSPWFAMCSLTRVQCRTRVKQFDTFILTRVRRVSNVHVTNCTIWHVYCNTRVKFDTCIIIHVSKRFDTSIGIHVSNWTRVFNTCVQFWHVY